MPTLTGGFMNYDYMTEEEESMIDDLMSMAHDATDPMDLLPSKYTREIKPSVYIDVYDVLKAWNVTNPALQHLIKKANEFFEAHLPALRW
jgi:hypothetical protein